LNHWFQSAAPPPGTGGGGVGGATHAGALEGYEDARVIGVVNQSDGYVLIEDPEGDLRA
jgi:hypothetical protein